MCKKKFFAVFMVLAMALTMALAGTASATDIWNGDRESEPELNGTVYEVWTGEELAWVADQVNVEENDFAGYTIRLRDDIDLDNRPWTPIGRFFAYGDVRDIAFRGTFDGAGHSITGLSVVNDGENYSARGETAALFGYIDYADSASSRSAAVSVSETPAVRAIADAASLGILEGSANYERVVAERTALYIKFGVSPSAGATRSVTPSYAIGGKVKNVKVYGSVSNTAGQGAAGVVCWNDGVIENCYFEGTVVCSPNSRAYAGGICSLLGDNVLSHNTYVVNCAASVNVQAIGSAYSYGGGIAGYCYAMNRGYIVNCAVEPASILLSHMDTGGIVGGFAYKVYNCTSAASSVTVNGQNPNEAGYFTGGIVGAFGTAYNCYWLQSSGSTTQPGYSVGGGSDAGGKRTTTAALPSASFLLPAIRDITPSETVTVSGTTHPVGASSSGLTYTWSSSNTSVATVSGSGASATVTGVGVGAATITATATNSSWTSVSDVAVTAETVVNVVSASRAAAMRASASGANGSESGSKSGGCNAGFAALALLALVPCAMVGRKRK